MKFSEILLEVNRPGVLDRLGARIVATLGSKQAKGEVETNKNFAKLWATFQKWRGSVGLMFDDVPVDTILSAMGDKAMQDALAELHFSSGDDIPAKRLRELIYTYAQIHAGRPPRGVAAGPPPPPPPAEPSIMKTKDLEDYLATMDQPTSVKIYNHLLNGTVPRKTDALYSVVTALNKLQLKPKVYKDVIDYIYRRSRSGPHTRRPTP